MSDDPKLSQRYRDLPREEPPRALDDKILAASRRAVELRPAPLVAPTGRRRWYFPVAAAAVIVLAVAVVAHVDREQPDVELATPPASLPEPSPPAAAEERRLEAPKPARRAEPSKQGSRAGANQQSAEAVGPGFTPDPRADSSPPAAAAPAPSAPPADVQKRMEQDRDVAAASAGARAREERPRAQSQVARASSTQSPEIELERIAELRAAGRHEQADKALAEFRKRYPDYRISDEMKAKVERRQ